MNVQKVLIVDDEEPLRSLVRLYLEQERFYVDEATNGRDALLKVNQQHYDLLVLDLMMPELDGWEVCRQIRRMGKDLPIIMLTAKTEVEDKLMGFDIGADDYISKPFDPRELVARIQALFRRTKEDANEEILISSLIINVPARSASVNRNPLSLTAKEFDLLYFFAKRQGKAFCREQLLEQIWGHEFLGESRTIDSHIKNLREKLRKAGLENVIHTVWGIGYKLEVEHDS
jgi:two-component system response regulator ResD